MMSPSRKTLRSTFPILPSRLRARKWKLALGSPLTWVSYLPVVGAYAFLDLPVAIFAGLLAAVTGGTFLYWKKQQGKLDTKLLRELIAESNQEQDEHLFGITEKLRKDGHADYATSLASFISKKQKIESSLHGDSETVSPATKELENLVDSLVFGVSDQFEKLAQIERKLLAPKAPLSRDAIQSMEAARLEISERIHEAWELLENTWGRLGDLVNPAAGIVGEDSSHFGLDQSIRKLKEEHEIALRVRERMNKEWSDTFSPDQPLETESE